MVSRFFWKSGLGLNFWEVSWSVPRMSNLKPDSKTSLLGVERERREDLTETQLETVDFSSDTFS